MCNFFFSVKLDNFGDVSLHYQSMIHNTCNSMQVQQSVKLHHCGTNELTWWCGWPAGVAVVTTQCDTEKVALLVSAHRRVCVCVLFWDRFTAAWSDGECSSTAELKTPSTKFCSLQPDINDAYRYLQDSKFFAFINLYWNKNCETSFWHKYSC